MQTDSLTRVLSVFFLAFVFAVVVPRLVLSAPLPASCNEETLRSLVVCAVLGLARGGTELGYYAGYDAGVCREFSCLLLTPAMSSLPCLVDSLQEGNCSLTDFEALSRCACTNIPLQASLSTCVQNSCNLTEQVRATVLLGDVCAGFPKESRRAAVKATAISCLALTVSVVSLRCVSRFSVSSRLWWDDWTTLLATIFLIGLASVKIVGSDLGFGFHYWNVDPRHAQTIFQLFYSAQMLYIMIQVTAKVSILALFWRIFTARWFRLAVWGCIAFLISHGLLFLLLITFQCIPVNAIWDRSISAKCLNVTAVGWAGAVFSILEDIVILVLPIPEVLKLQLTFKKKVALCLMFSIGSFACVTSMVRLKYMVAFANTMDATWDNVDIVIWSIIEVTCAIICGSLPTLRPLLQKVPGLLTSAKHSDYIGGGVSAASGTQDKRSRTRSDILTPVAFRKLADAPWETEGSREAKTKLGRKTAADTTFTSDVASDSGSKYDVEMDVLVKAKSTV
ncbi:Satratoxin biosynthesis SC7 cluster protein [Paramyrothecium foliicola]|nr:Satratoxin biosynthesis SC7 cluster protein [Paramyrothecium foliicola]